MEICVVGDFDLDFVPDDVESDSGGSTSASSDTGSALSFTSSNSAGDHRFISKADVEKLIVEAGGTLTSNPREGKTALVLAPNGKSLRCKMLIKSQKFDIVRMDYLLRCIRKGTLAEPSTYDYIYITQATKQKLARQMDCYGNSCTQELTVKGLKSLFKRMERPKRSWREEAIASLDEQEQEEIFTKGSSKNLFWQGGRFCIYLDRHPDMGTLKSSPTNLLKCPFSATRQPLPVTRLDHASNLIQYLGGCVAEVLHPHVTHVVVDLKDRRRFHLIAQRLKELRRLPMAQVEKHVVTVSWVYDCIAAHQVLEVSQEYSVRLV